VFLAALTSQGRVGAGDEGECTKKRRGSAEKALQIDRKPFKLSGFSQQALIPGWSIQASFPLSIETKGSFQESKVVSHKSVSTLLSKRQGETDYGKATR
jgi:hypothetical protein